MSCVDSFSVEIPPLMTFAEQGLSRGCSVPVPDFFFAGHRSSFVRCNLQKKVCMRKREREGEREKEREGNGKNDKQVLCSIFSPRMMKEGRKSVIFQNGFRL